MAKVRKSATDQSHVNKLYRDRIEQGNENQREWYAGVRDFSGLGSTDQYGNRAKWSKEKSKREGTWLGYNAQRAGGKGK
jgi:hypothetical protein